jgi:hypothetical protein
MLKMKTDMNIGVIGALELAAVAKDFPVAVPAVVPPVPYTAKTLADCALLCAKRVLVVSRFRVV